MRESKGDPSYIIATISDYKMALFSTLRWHIEKLLNFALPLIHTV